jgi:hypothetical protein
LTHTAIVRADNAAAPGLGLGLIPKAGARPQAGPDKPEFSTRMIRLQSKLEGVRIAAAFREHFLQETSQQETSHQTATLRPVQSPRRRSASTTLAVLAAGFAAFAAVGCGNQYRPVVSAINPVGPAGQPTKYAAAVSTPSAGSLGLLTVVDFSGDTVITTPQILADPNYFALNSAGTQGFTIDPQGSFNSFLLANPVGLLTSDVVQTTLPVNSSPVSITAVTPASALASIFIPQQATSSIAALNAGTAALFEDIAVGNGGTNPVYVVGAPGTPRVYAISQNSPGSLGQIDALESISATQLSVSKTIPVGIKPVYGVETSDDRRAFILNETSGIVSVVNVPSNGLDVTTPTIPLCPTPSTTGIPCPGVNPVWADLAPTVSELVVLNQGDGINPGTLSIIQIPLCSSLAQPTNPLCNFNNPVDGVGFGQIVATATVGINPVMVSVLQDGSRAYVANGGNATTPGSVSVVNLASGVVTATLPCVPDPTDTSVTPTGDVYGLHPNSISATTGSPTGKIYITSSDSRYLTIIYTDTDTVQGHINLQGLGLRVLVTTP